MNASYSNALYITETYLHDLQRANAYLKKKKLIMKKTQLKKSMYRRLTNIQKNRNLQTEVRENTDNTEILKQLHIQEEQIHSFKESTYTPSELAEKLKELEITTARVYELLLPKVQPWNRYVPLFKVFSIRFGKARAGIIILLWMCLFILLPLLVNIIIFLAK